MQTSCRTTLAVIAVILAPALGRASTLASVNFESDALGNLAGQTGGSGWTGGWTAPAGNGNIIDTTASPLSYSISGGATLNGATHAYNMVNTAAASGQVMGSRQFATSLTGNSFFVSYLVQYSGTGTFDPNDTLSLYLSSGAGTTANAFNFGPRATGTSQQTFMVRQGTGGPVTGGSVTLAAGSFPAGQTYLAVAQYVWDGTSYSTVNAWLNPAPGDAGTPQVTQSITAGTGLTSISHVFFREFSTSTLLNDAWTVDNLTVGTTWADVVIVPEPTSMALLGLGALAWATSRRRKA